MSSRARRKLQQERDLLNGQQNEGDNIEAEEIPSTISVKKKSKSKKNGKLGEKTGNVFDLLQNDDDVDDDLCDNDEEEFDMKTEEGFVKNTKNAHSENMGESRKAKQTSVKKKKKKDETTVEVVANENEDEIDRSVREVNEMLGITEIITARPNHSAECNGTSLETKSIFCVEHRHLNADEEMKRRFGAEVVRHEQRRRNQHDNRYRRQTWLIVPKPSWGNIGRTGINMSIIEKGDSCNLFTFEHSAHYQKTQFLFLDAVNSMDHNGIMALLNAHPSHIDSMLQMSEICSMNEDHAMAAELIERSLYVYESSFHPLFNVTTGTVRLQFKRAENRPFFLSIFRHIHFVGQRACYRTSLEFCKLLLSLDPVDDPLCALLLIDYYAIKSEQYDYLIRLFDELECSRNLSLLPNFAYSIALAYFHREDREKANEMLGHALLAFPSVIPALMNKCGVVLQNGMSEHNYLASPTLQAPALQQLSMLYAARCHSMWKPPEVLDWLGERCAVVLPRIDCGEIDVTEYNERRKTRYTSSPRNVLRHISITDFKEVMAELPPAVRSEPILMYDPLPPPDSTVGYERPVVTPRRNTDANGGMFSLFFRSLMPSYGSQAEADLAVANGDYEEAVRHLQDRVERAAEPEAELEAGASNERNALAGGANRLMEAMRELLTTMTYRDDLDRDGEEGPGNEEWNDPADM